MSGEEDLASVESNKYFDVLGYDGEYIIVFQKERNLLLRRKADEWSMAALISLAPMNFWELTFSGRFTKTGALDAMCRLADRRGQFDPSQRRGRGAWLDQGRVAFNLGDRLVVDGAPHDFRWPSGFTYEARPPLGDVAEQCLSPAEAERLLEILQGFCWKSEGAALLVLGWCALAIGAGCLTWRPHLWITGPSGSGKTTVMMIIYGVLGRCAVLIAGPTTEAGLRQHLESDARPVVYDEAEQNHENEARHMDGVLALIRQSSSNTGARILKGTSAGAAMTYQVCSAFCLSSIQVGIKLDADASRLTVLELERPGEADRASWLATGPDRLPLDGDYAAKLLKFSIDHAQLLRANAASFSHAAAIELGSARAGDQLGTLLAGAYTLLKQRPVTDAELTKWLTRFTWRDFRPRGDDDDAMQALGVLLAALIPVGSGSFSSVAELVTESARNDRRDQGHLTRHGLVVRRYDGQTWLYVARRHSRHKALLQGSPYAIDLARQLERLPGAKPHLPTTYGAGPKYRGTRIPISLVCPVEDDAGGAAADLRGAVKAT